MKNAEQIFQAIANEVGVSPRTVKRTLAQPRKDTRPTYVERAKRIRSLAEAHGYRPNAAARAVRMGRFGQVAMLTRHDVSFQQFNLNKGVCTELAAHDLHMILAEIRPGDLAKPETSPRLLRELCVDGLIVHFAQKISPATLEAVSYSGVPLVWTNLDQATDSVCTDDAQGVRLATETLLEIGHRRIGLLAGPHAKEEFAHYSVRDRREGYLQAMQQAGLSPNIKEFKDDSGYAEGLSRAIDLLDSEPHITAWICDSDVGGGAILMAALAKGLKVPRDLSVIMFHNLSPNGSMGLPISAMALPMQKVGAEAARMLLRKIANPQEPQPCCKVPFSAPPVIRTIGPPRQNK